MLDGQAHSENIGQQPWHVTEKPLASILNVADIFQTFCFILISGKSQQLRETRT